MSPLPLNRTGFFLALAIIAVLVPEEGPAQELSVRRAYIEEVRPHATPRDAAVEDRLSQAVTERLLRESRLDRAANKGESDLSIQVYYERRAGALILHGLLFDGEGRLFDALTYGEDFARIREYDASVGVELLSDAETVSIFADELIFRLLSNPNLRLRRENVDEFLLGTGPGRSGTFRLAASEAGGPSEVFQILGEERVSVGSRTVRQTAEIPATIRVISEADIRRHGYRYLEDLLRDQPGFDLIFFQGLYGTTFNQRGLDAPETIRTIVLVDGVPDNNISQGNAYIKHKYSLHNVRRVEILYGPASSLYGANAFSGVINIITKDGADVANYLEYGFGSLYYEPPFGRPAPNAYATVGRAIDLGEHSLDIIASGHWIDTAGQRVNDQSDVRPARSMYYWTDSYAASGLDNNYAADLKISYGIFSLGARHVRDHSGQGTFATGAAYVDDSNFAFWNADTRTYYGRLKTDIGDRLHEELTISYRDTSITDGTDADYLTFGDLLGPVRITRYRRPDREIAVDNPLTVRWTRYMETTFGLSYVDQYAWNYNTRRQSYDNRFGVELMGLPLAPDLDPRNKFRITNRAGYLEHNWRAFSGVGLVLGYRYDAFEISGSDAPQFCGTNEPVLPGGGANASFVSETSAALQGCQLESPSGLYFSHEPTRRRFSASNPRAGIVFNPGERWRARLLYGEAFRVPTVRESYSVSTSRVTNGNLEPERIRTTEAGLTFLPLPEIKTDLALFHNYVRDIIFLAGTGIHRPGRKANDNLSRFQNAGKAQVDGFDFTMEAHPLEPLRFYVGYSYQHAILFDVRDPGLLAHDGRAPGTVVIEGVTVCRSLLQSANLGQIEEVCGSYHGRMPRVATHKLNLGANLMLFDHFRFDLRANWVGERANIATNPEPTTPGYLLVNLLVGLADWPLSGMDINFKVFNLLDQTIYDPGFRDASGSFFPTVHPQPGLYFAWELTHRL
ncbi:MAG: TonB-dependent receptor [Spirochaetales bacterium]|nr:TonB-dependent receptor [Leptospiraceae bacterium]MCP5483348.1 TonB-dependent receptor [Spirochaetales bacterium]MCP5484137.1 TonB-dependent receptor [Spirochaetales bacterium]